MDSDYVQLARQPENISKTLFPHQLANIYKMELLEKEKRIVQSENQVLDTNLAFLADKVGSGKTITILSVISNNKMPWDCNIPLRRDWVQHKARNLVSMTVTTEYEKLYPNLILVSPSIIHQWCQEIKTSTKLTFYKIVNHKDISKLDNIYETEDKTLSKFDIVLVVPTMYNYLMQTFRKRAWKRFIFDEPGHLNVPNMDECISGFMWLVTATVLDVGYRHRSKYGFMRDMSNLFTDVFGRTSNYIDSGLIIRNTNDFINASYQMPKVVYKYYSCINHMYNAIYGFVSSHITSLISANDIEGAITALGGTKTSNIIDLVKQKKLEELEEIKAKIRIYTIRNDQQRLTEWTNRQTSIENQIKELESRFSTLLSSNCNICLGQLDNPVLEPSCQNIFCGTCIFTWLQKNPSCPLCRQNVCPKSLVYINQNDEGTSSSTLVKNKQNSDGKTKMETVVDIINSNPSGKFIVYSQYEQSFISICKALEENDISYKLIKGASSTRNRVLEEFREGKYKVIFLNSTSDGAGINLQEATDIIMYHDMTTGTETQIIGRALRIGRLLPLSVHYLKLNR